MRSAPPDGRALPLREGFRDVGNDQQLEAEQDDSAEGASSTEVGAAWPWSAAGFPVATATWDVMPRQTRIRSRSRRATFIPSSRCEGRRVRDTMLGQIETFDHTVPSGARPWVPLQGQIANVRRSDTTYARISANGKNT